MHFCGLSEMMDTPTPSEIKSGSAITPETHLWWCGWQTTVGALQSNGWEIYERRRFQHNTAHRLARNGCYWYAKNRAQGMIIRVTIPEEHYCVGGETWNVDFMVHISKFQKAENKISIRRQLKDLGVTPDDIPFLFDMIIELQKEQATSKPRKIGMSPVLGMPYNQAA